MMLVIGKEIVHFMRATLSSRPHSTFAKPALSKHFAQVLSYGRGMNTQNGNALAGRLAKSAFDLGVCFGYPRPPSN